MQDSTLRNQTPRCELCDTAFPAKRKPTRFCSILCRNRYIAKQPRRILGKVCPRCGHYGRDRKSDMCSTCDRTRWTLAETAYLIEHYPSQGAQAVAAALGKTHEQALCKANALKLAVNRSVRQILVHEQARAHMTENNPMKRAEVKAKVRAWQDSHPEAMAEVRAALAAGHARLERNKPSGLEQKLRGLLTDMGVSFEPSAVIKPNFVVDVRIGTLIIEADGDYWHGHPRLEPLTVRQQAQQKRDRSRNTYLAACGYAVVRIWESDLTRGHLEAILKEQAVIPE